ncbi:MAG TPA: tRNA dihydrouridine synthase DusB [Acidimicrobiales bacterium]
MNKPPLTIGPFELSTPVVLAPMAGVTNPPFRLLCAEQGAGLLVSEMVSARGLVEGNQRSRDMVGFHADEARRSVQLHAVEPDVAAAAVALLVGDHGVHHVDLNFGCPVPKVTRKGGGAAIPVRRRLFADIVTAAVSAGERAGGVPVTVKMRMGTDDSHHTYLAAGRVAASAGAAAISLHARTAADLYGPPARWSAIASLVETVAAVAPDVPVLGNGDIWIAPDAVAMMEATGCAGVVIGRGCLGRPWMFRDLEAVFSGTPAAPPPDLVETLALLRRHGELLVEWFGESNGVRDLRKHVKWYVHGFPVGSELRRRLGLIDTLDDLVALTDELVERHGPIEMDTNGLLAKRGHTRGPQRVVLPSGWYDRTDDPTPPVGADLAISGG